MNKYKITLKPQAIKDLNSLRKFEATTIADKIEKHLIYRPYLTSKSKIKRLRGRQKADYRLRVGNYRIFYTIDNTSNNVYILRIMHKRQTAQFYQEE